MGSHFQDCFWGGNGFEELKAHMKTGTEFCKDLEGFFSDRADLEKEYANGLHKILKKARKSSKKTVSSIENVWSKVISSMETEEENHRTLSATLSADGAKVMKAFTEGQVSTRQPAVSAVEKQHKHFIDKHRSQLKNKRSTFKCCRDLESSWEQLEDFKSGKSAKQVSEKDITKLEKHCRKLEESLVKAYREYRDSNLKTEESRLAWENAMYKCCNTLETLEYERIQQVQTMLTKYCDLLQTVIPPIETTCQEVVQTADEVSPDGDIDFTCCNLGPGPNQPEQLLLDCYEEDFHNSMNSERRRASLEKKIQHIEEEIERQQRAKSGVEQLAKVYQEQPDFTDEKGAEDVTRQLVEADCLLNMLKANHFKLLCAHAEISNAPRPSSHFADYITTSTDKHNQPLSILKIPIDQISDVQMNYEPPSLPRQKSITSKRGSVATKSAATANGGRAEVEDLGDDYVEMEGGRGSLEFDEQDDEFDNGYDYVGQCKVLYDYQANQDDELSIQPGDVINIMDKYDPDWWQGELNGNVGIFPVSYVEDM